MQRLWWGAVAASAIGLAGCATTPAADNPITTADNSSKICKRMPVMGSNFPKTVCSTAEEWAEFERETRESVDAYDKDRKPGNTQGSFEN